MALMEYGARLVMIEQPAPVPSPDELLVRVEASGLCGTDLKIVAGKMDLGPLPRILGHEIAGVVEGCGKDADPGWLGKRVALHLYSSCGKCPMCAAGDFNLCEQLPGRLGFEFPGGLAEYVVSPARCAVEIPKNLSFEDACVSPCAMLTVFHALQRAGVTTKDKVALIGVGGLGIHGLQILTSLGVAATAVDIAPAKLELAQELGASEVLLYNEFMANQEKYDIIVDMIGKTEAARIMCDEKLKRRGRYLLISFLPGAKNTFDAQRLAMDECQIIGVRNGSIQELRQTIELQADGCLKPIIDQVLPLEKANEALDLIRGGLLMGRVVIRHPSKTA
jgi:propanol-preferring alcohol dehydrogenase